LGVERRATSVDDACEPSPPRGYVTPLREGGSLPALVEADDDGLYVCKFRGTGQGSMALVPEVSSWHKRLWLIDHGAALYAQHGPEPLATHARRPFAAIADHVLLNRAQLYRRRRRSVLPIWSRQR